MQKGHSNRALPLAVKSICLLTAQRVCLGKHAWVSGFKIFIGRYSQRHKLGAITNEIPDPQKESRFSVLGRQNNLISVSNISKAVFPYASQGPNQQAGILEIEPQACSDKSFLHSYSCWDRDGSKASKRLQTFRSSCLKTGSALSFPTKGRSEFKLIHNCTSST